MRKRFHRALSLLTALAMALGLLGASAMASDQSGTCGEHLTWKLSGSTLTISGKGPMYDFDDYSSECGFYGTAPWADDLKQIKTVVLKEGVTSVGSMAFCCDSRVKGSTAIRKVSLPDSLTCIGSRAFQWCGRLTEVTIPKKVNWLGVEAFGFCSALKKVRFKGKAPALGDGGQMEQYSWPFNGASPTVWYPAGDRTWTKTKRENMASLSGAAWRKWNPDTTSITSLKRGRRKAFVKWRKAPGVNGYQLQYSTCKRFKKAGKKLVRGAKKTSVTLKRLKGGRRYYFRVRTCRVDAKKKYYSAWSKARAVTVKK